MSEERQLLYCWFSESLAVLVPKKRGTGFLKVPLGHHSDHQMMQSECDLHCDIDGLEGYLDIQCGLKIGCYEEKRTKFAAKAMPMLEKRYDCSGSIEIGRDEFFSHLGLNPLP